jgi:hypothetical protein
VSRTELSSVPVATDGYVPDDLGYQFGYHQHRVLRTPFSLVAGLLFQNLDIHQVLRPTAGLLVHN